MQNITLVTIFALVLCAKANSQLSSYEYKLDSTVYTTSWLTDDFDAVIPITNRYTYDLGSDNITYEVDWGHEWDFTNVANGTQVYTNDQLNSDNWEELNLFGDGNFDDYATTFTYDLDNNLTVIETQMENENGVLEAYEKIEIEYTIFDRISEITEYDYENGQWVEKKRYEYSYRFDDIETIYEFDNGETEAAVTTEYSYNNFGPHVIHTYFGSTLNYTDTLFYEGDGVLTHKHSWWEFSSDIYRVYEYDYSFFFDDYLFQTEISEMVDGTLEVVRVEDKFYNTEIMDNQVAQPFEEFDYPDPLAGLHQITLALTMEQTWDVEGDTWTQEEQTHYYISENKITGVQETLEPSTNLLYPIPVVDEFQVNASAGTSWTITNEQGLVLMAGTSETVDATALKDGIYFLQADGKVQKFVKQ